MLTGKFSKVDDGRWAVEFTEAATIGMTATIRKRNGETQSIVVGKLIRFVKPNTYLHEIDNSGSKRTADVGSMGGVIALFKKAKLHLKFPAIVMSVPGFEAVRVNMAGEKARHPGSLNVCAMDRQNDDGRRVWFGRIFEDGKFEMAGTGDKAELAAIAKRLQDFSAEPIKIASEHGRLTGRCCFCNIELTDERSTSIGYGPICADHYGLPWGDRPAQFAADATVKPRRRRRKEEAA